jgi:APA family basic amino acid/polyamine antiporter
LCWIIGGIVSILGGLCFAELGASRPIAGGMTIYLSEAYHPALGFINGFSGFILTGSGSIAALAMAAVTGFKGVLDLSDTSVKIISIAIIVLFTALNLRGARLGVAFQNFTMVARVVPLVLIILLGIFMGSQTPDLSLTVEGTSASGGSIVGIISMIGYATFASLWAYEGWANLNTVGEEMKNPKRDLPLAIIISLGFIITIYTLFQFAIYRVLPSDQIVSMISSGDIYLGNAVAQNLMGNFGHVLILAGMTIGILGTVNGDVLVFPRTYYAMAKEGYFPKKFAEIDEKSGVPVAATLASSAIAIVLVVFNSLQELTDIVITLSAFLNVLCIGAVIIYRKKYPKLERPYKVWGGIPTIILTIILFGILLVNELVSDPKAAVTGLIVPAIGLVVYAYFRKKNGGQDYKGEGIE